MSEQRKMNISVDVQTVWDILADLWSIPESILFTKCISFIEENAKIISKSETFLNLPFDSVNTFLLSESTYMNYDSFRVLLDNWFNHNAKFDLTLKLHSSFLDAWYRGTLHEIGLHQSDLNLDINCDPFWCSKIPNTDAFQGDSVPKLIWGILQKGFGTAGKCCLLEFLDPMYGETLSMSIDENSQSSNLETLKLSDKSIQTDPSSSNVCKVAFAIVDADANKGTTKTLADCVPIVDNVDEVTNTQALRQSDDDMPLRDRLYRKGEQKKTNEKIKQFLKRQGYTPEKCPEKKPKLETGVKEDERLDNPRKSPTPGTSRRNSVITDSKPPSMFQKPGSGSKEKDGKRAKKGTISRVAHPGKPGEFLRFCDDCESWASYTSFTSHQRGHKYYLVHFCQACNIVFSAKDALLKHVCKGRLDTTAAKLKNVQDTLFIEPRPEAPRSSKVGQSVPKDEKSPRSTNAAINVAGENKEAVVAADTAIIATRKNNLEPIHSEMRQIIQNAVLLF